MRCLREGVEWLAAGSVKPRVAGKSGISQARTRLGWEPVRRLHDDGVKPVAVAATKGARYGRWRVVSLDGGTLDVAHESANAAAFGRPGSSRGASAWPQIHFVSLVENGTRVRFGTQMAGCETGEVALAKTVLPSLAPGMLCLAGRDFFGYRMGTQAAATGADLPWRARKNILSPRDQRLPDGSFL